VTNLFIFCVLDVWGLAQKSFVTTTTAATTNTSITCTDGLRQCVDERSVVAVQSTAGSQTAV